MLTDTEKSDSIRRVTWAGVLGNILLSGLKFAVGVLGSSQAVVADAVHSLADLTTDAAILIGVRYWSVPADECHPYGHRRIETMITAGIGLVLAAAALGIGYRGLVTIGRGPAEQPGLIAFWGAAVSIAAKEGLYRWTASVGKRARSAALIANAWHHRSDALSSAPAALAVGIAAVNPHWSFVDHVGAVVVSGLILHASWKIMKPALLELSESSASRGISSRIRTVSEETEGVDSVHAIRTRRQGSAVFADLHVVVDGSMSVARGHSIAGAVKHRILEQIEDVVDVVVHLEPSEGSDKR